jgi:hypothetical protein
MWINYFTHNSVLNIVEESETLKIRYPAQHVPFV